MESVQDFSGVSGRRLPGFVKGWAIVDLALSSLRMCVAVFSAIFFLWLILQGSAENPADPVAIGLEAVLAGLVGASGIVAAIAILLRRKWGVLCGWICAGLTFLSILQQFIYTVVKMSGAANGDAAYQFGVVIGAFLGSGARVVLMVFYLIMLVQAGRFFAQHE
ncbi:hypothetical protein [uncultured Victivallis sp.]|uniref:hypothetical protein n=1 Tax=uncultured Victivallis sp. TaxID=354118 RepID=UPI0025F73872|nr:hypothetical protein [uncultured Victivallis sp.]